MRDLFFLLVLAAMFAMAFKRPFLFVLTYAYIDIVSPQRLSYFLLNSAPISAIAFGLAFLGWLAIDNKRDSRFSWRQLLMILLLVWSSARAYYFCFYVIERYIDPGYRFAGLGSAIRHVLRGRSISDQDA